MVISAGINYIVLGSLGSLVRRERSVGVASNLIGSLSRERECWKAEGPSVCPAEGVVALREDSFAGPGRSVSLGSSLSVLTDVTYNLLDLGLWLEHFLVRHFELVASGRHSSPPVPCHRGAGAVVLQKAQVFSI